MIEELADMCVEDLREGINTESKFIQAEHELKADKPILCKLNGGDSWYRSNLLAL